MIGRDVLIGCVLSGLLMEAVPLEFWRGLFGDSLVASVLIGPLVSMASFVCSIGNLPLAGVLYDGGIRFGGAISFIYADLVILPLLLIYRRYWGTGRALRIAGLLYVSMALAGLVVDQTFEALGWIPTRGGFSHHMRHAELFEINYTFWLNLVFGALAVALVVIARQPSDEGESTEEHSCCH